MAGKVEREIHRIFHTRSSAKLWLWFTRRSNNSSSNKRGTLTQSRVRISRHIILEGRIELPLDGVEIHSLRGDRFYRNVSRGAIMTETNDEMKEQLKILKELNKSMKV